MLRLYVLLIFTLISSASGLAKKRMELAENLAVLVYPEVKIISEELLKICPPEDCVLVGVGRSPTPILAHLEALYPKSVLNLPLSADGAIIALREEEKFEKYFQRKVIDKIPKNKKQILLFDYVRYGRSFYYAGEFLASRFEDQGFKIKTAGMHNSVGEVAIDPMSGNFQHLIDHLIPIDDMTILHFLRSKSFDDFADYETFNFVGKDGPQRNLTGKDKEFKYYMRKQLLEDEDYLKKLGVNKAIIESKGEKFSFKNCLRLLLSFLK
ncbi:MAG: hypothetical protein ACPGJV_14395 [Bacteriovoracaceae bacterium]